MTEHPYIDFSDPRVTIRTGTQNPHTLYAHGPGLPERGHPVGYANTAAYAQGIVARANAGVVFPPPLDDWNSPEDAAYDQDRP